MKSRNNSLNGTIQCSLTALVLSALAAPLTHADTEVKFGEDLSSEQGNSVSRIAYPNSKAVADAFQTRLGGVDAVDFESLTATKTPGIIDLTFGEGHTATLKGMSEFVEIENQATTYNGAFPTSGTKCVLLMAKAGAASADATIMFSEMQGAFGFYVTDIERNTFQIELIRDGQDNEVVTVPATHGPDVRSGGICFVGVINKEKPFRGVKFSNSGGVDEGFGFDDMMIAHPAKILPAPKLPGEFVIETYGIDGEGIKSRPGHARHFIGAVGSELKIVAGSLNEAKSGEKNVSTIHREDLEGGLVALKVGDKYLPDFASTPGAANKYRVINPLQPPTRLEKDTHYDFISLQLASDPTKYLRHGGFRVYNGAPTADEQVDGSDSQVIFRQDSTWHFHVVKK